MALEKLGTEVRQEQLAQAALDLIAAHGMKALSIARVARHVGLVPSAIYRHFEGKDQLIEAVIGLMEDRLHNNIDHARTSACDSLERLRLLLLAHISVIRENRGILRIVFSDEVHKGHPEKKTRIYEMISGYLNRVTEIIAEGQGEGRIRSDVDAGTISVMFLGLIQPASILWNMSDHKFDVTKHAERAWPVFRDAIAAEQLARARCE